jgi:hypothetical protein
LFADGHMTAFRNRQAEIKTDPQGVFVFAPRLDGGRIYAAAQAGYAECGVEELAKTPKITLQPWGRIQGTLIQAGKPVTNETLSVTSAAAFNPDRPHVNLQHRTVTDSLGAFEFGHVPPGQMQIVTLVPVGPEGLTRGWTHLPQVTLTVAPGETVSVKVEKQNAQPSGMGAFNSFRSLSAKPAPKP